MAGPALIYFHGVPGSSRELVLAGAPPGRIAAVDRLADRTHLAAEAYFDALADDLRAGCPEGGLRLIGFSLGARAALEVAARLGERVRGIDLIAPGGPLELGDFLPGMEGRSLFTVARRAPWAVPAMLWTHGRLAAWAPERLVSIVFANAAGGDADLMGDPSFVAAVTAILRDSLLTGAAGYARELVAYARPWASLLPRVTQPASLWCGTLDNWAPPAMSQTLGSKLANARPLRLLDGLSHYSALKAALPLILAEAG